MAKEIPGELKTFKEKVEPGIGTMRSTVSHLVLNRLRVHLVLLRQLYKKLIVVILVQVKQ